MGYFSNSTEWDFWASDNCMKCRHWPKTDEAPGCPVEMAHMLYGYELCNETDHPGKVILDMLIPRNKGDVGNRKCAMFVNKDGVTDRHLKDWEKYKAAMANAATGAST